MHFEYEITADEYVASQFPYHKLRRRRGAAERAIAWILAGSFCLVIASNERVLNWVPVLLVATGACWIYGEVTILFPARYLRRAYRGTELVGKTFKGDVNEDGFKVTGDLCNWSAQWPGGRLKNENEQVFILYAEGTIFMFGKKYLNNEQQQELRRLSGLTTSRV